VASQHRIDAVRDAPAPLAPRGVPIVPAFDEAVLLPRFWPAWRGSKRATAWRC
jgi:hypothetical protein